MAMASGDKTTTSDYSYLMADGHPREFIWVCELSKENPSAKWEIEADDGDKDFLCHTLFLKQAVLGADTVDKERNVVSLETSDFFGQSVNQPIISLTSGVTDSCGLDMNFSSEIPVTFHLTSGSGPVCITGAHLVEFPDMEEDYNFGQYGSTVEMLSSAADADAGTLTEQDDDDVKLNAKKRKATSALDKKDKHKKLHVSNTMEQDNEDNGLQVSAEQDDEGEAEEDDDDDDDFDDEADEEEDDDSESDDEDYSDDSNDDEDGADSGEEMEEDLSKVRKPTSSKRQLKSGAKGDETRTVRAKGVAEQKTAKQIQYKTTLHPKKASMTKRVGSSTKKLPSNHSRTGKSRPKKSK